MPDAIAETSTPAAVETPAPVEESTSLADHEDAYGVGRQAPPADPEPAQSATDDGVRERDDKGQFKPRHRAKSQQASPDDVPRIQELTRRLRERDAELETLRQAKPAEPARTAPAAAAPTRATDSFPAFDAWLAIDANKDKQFEDFLDARADWRYDQRRAAERADEARVSAQRTERQALDAYVSQMPDVLKEYPDFDEVVSPGGQPIRVSMVIEKAVVKVGPRAAYYLATHPEERDALTEETAVTDPDHPAFGAAVAAMSRYLRTLVAPEQRSTSPSRTAAVSTGSALALVPPSVPKPPNPVRTGAMKDADAPPSDESSLAEHERAFAPRSRRA